jgi:hypothetical protein
MWLSAGLNQAEMTVFATIENIHPIGLSIGEHQKIVV